VIKSSSAPIADGANVKKTIRVAPSMITITICYFMDYAKNVKQLQETL